jgi:energy-coupling factor transporter ATP-binding protein EcfA2
MLHSSVVGLPGEHPGISDGERKLLSIAIELVGVPPVLCLDDPMSGLDTSSTTRVADVLRSLAHQHGKTILCTISQPSSLILSFCDNLLILSHGEVAYSGLISNLDDYLSSIDSTLSPQERAIWSPIEFALDRLSCPMTAVAYITAWRGSTENKWLENDPNVEIGRTMSVTVAPDHPVLTNTSFKLRHPEYENTFFEQLLIFIKRHGHYKLISDAGGVKTILGRFIIAGVLFGFTFKDVGQKVDNLTPIFNWKERHLYASVYNLLGLMFCYSVFVTVSNFLPIPSLFDMRKLYDLEMVSSTLNLPFCDILVLCDLIF